MMKEISKKIDRREFLKTAVGTAFTSAIASSKLLADVNDVNKPEDVNKPANGQETYPKVPTRPFGRTNIQVPVLSFGAMFDIVENQILLHKTLQWGVNYWDTALSYAGGRSEQGIGQFLAKYPDRRKDIFIVTKASGARDNASRTQCLQTSLQRMNTNYVDLYYGVHALKDPADLNEELKNWAAEAKAKGLIRYFGFSTHQNMAECLMAASKLDWIDAIMTSYNFRLMQDANLVAAIDACHKAGIAIIAMKVQAHRSAPDDTKALDNYFIQKGFTEGQAKIKAVLQDERICSACVTMKSVAILTSNIAAVLDRTELADSDLEFMNNFAKQTCNGYCAGCANICASAVPQMPYISDVLRSLMYHHNYGDKALAKEVFSNVASRLGKSITNFDYSAAEKVCPNRIPIGSLMKEAYSLLA